MIEWGYPIFMKYPRPPCQLTGLAFFLLLLNVTIWIQKESSDELIAEGEIVNECTRS
jgi:hypothetical protein